MGLADSPRYRRCEIDPRNIKPFQRPLIDGTVTAFWTVSRIKSHWGSFIARHGLAEFRAIEKPLHSRTPEMYVRLTPLGMAIRDAYFVAIAETEET